VLGRNAWRGERVPHTQLRCDRRTSQRRAEHPQLADPNVRRHRHDRAERVSFRELAALERQDLGEQVVDLGIRSTQCRRRHRIGPRGAPEAQVDPARVQCLESAEHLDHVERRVVRDHDAATCAIITPGAEAAMLAMLWCSATQ
jgi:hypothetical protein